jgi:biotin carboxyl carrier protein
MGFRLMLDGEEHEITVLRRRPHLVLRIDGIEHEFSELGGAGDGRHELKTGTQHIDFLRATDDERQIVRMSGRTFVISRIDPFSEGADAGGSQDALRAPMPGVVVSIHCKEGDQVMRGAPLITIESMKLQTVLSAMRDGTVARILRTEGETFEKDEVVVMLESETQKA